MSMAYELRRLIVDGQTAIKVIGFGVSGSRSLCTRNRWPPRYRRRQKDCSLQCGPQRRIWEVDRPYGVRITAAVVTTSWNDGLRVGGVGEAIRRAQNFRSRVSIVRPRNHDDGGDTVHGRPPKYSTAVLCARVSRRLHASLVRQHGPIILI